MADTLEEKRDKQLDRLKNSVKMYENTLRSTVKRMQEETNADGTRKYTDEDIDIKIAEIKDMGENDVIAQFEQLGGDMREIAELVSDPREPLSKKKTGKLSLNVDDVKKISVNKKSDKPVTIEEKMQKVEKKEETFEPAPLEVKKKAEITETKFEPEDYTYFIPKTHPFDPTRSYDIIPLPSKGECYASKISRVAVEALCGYDENMIFQPNLHRDGKIIDVLLKNKIVNDDGNGLDPMDMLDGDRDAIVLWLRATGYGNEYPVSLRDPETGEDFDATVDLSTLKFKPFTLKGDENGWFTYNCPVSKDVIKFRFLTHRDRERLMLYQKYENDLILKGEVLNMAKTIDVFLNANTDLEDKTKQYLKNAKEALNSAERGIDANDAIEYDDAVTNQLELAVMAVNGNTDKRYISEYIRRMPIRDAYDLRAYIKENEPGVDFSFEVEKPESLGGGSMPVSFQVNSIVLLNFKR